MSLESEVARIQFEIINKPELPPGADTLTDNKGSDIPGADVINADFTLDGEFGDNYAFDDTDLDEGLADNFPYEQDPRNNVTKAGRDKTSFNASPNSAKVSKEPLPYYVPRLDQPVSEIIDNVFAVAGISGSGYVVAEHLKELTLAQAEIRQEELARTGLSSPSLREEFLYHFHSLGKKQLAVSTRLERILQAEIFNLAGIYFDLGENGEHYSETGGNLRREGVARIIDQFPVHLVDPYIDATFEPDAALIEPTIINGALGFVANSVTTDILDSNQRFVDVKRRYLDDKTIKDLPPLEARNLEMSLLTLAELRNLPALIISTIGVLPDKSRNNGTIVKLETHRIGLNKAADGNSLGTVPLTTEAWYEVNSFTNGYIEDALRINISGEYDKPQNGPDQQDEERKQEELRKRKLINVFRMANDGKGAHGNVGDYAREILSDASRQSCNTLRDVLEDLGTPTAVGELRKNSVSRH